MNDFNSDWLGCSEPQGNLADKRAALAARTARALGVPVDEVQVTEHPESQGVRLTGHWYPA